MKKRYYSFSTAILTSATIFSLMGSHNVLADNIDRNQITTYSEATPSHITSIWTKGVTPPTNFIEGTDGSHAPYIANQGWYDITKTFNGKDDLLCAAATAGNMLHWW
ncbi:IdeS/Mac family cysteine endopeptidase, partial [Streptococcus canis]